MNYRHAFHAGNFADVFKHVLLTRILVYLMLKPTPLRYLDTHSGIGLYDLTSETALRTGEWRGGIGAIIGADMPTDIRALLTPYIEAARLDPNAPPSLYPGSPILAQRMTRTQDRLTLCELHVEDARTLAGALGRDRRVKALHIDGYVALNAYVPPVERRGLALIDPPFEAPDEFERLAQAVEAAWIKWPTGVYALWYPLKNPAAARRFGDTLARGRLRRALRLEFEVEPARPDRPLAGCGLIVVNPPFPLEAEARALLPWLTQRLARSPDATWRVDWLIGE